MFDPELYPTPPEVIKRMLKPWQRSEFFPDLDLGDITILEPSAGSGSILDYIKENHSWARNRGPNERGPKLHAIEHNPELRAMLTGKGYSVVHDDFLDYQTDIIYDLIIMNPPFSNGERHLLKAWDILKTGTVVCLLNAETLKNPHTIFRKHLLKLIGEHGKVNLIGKAFAKAMRSTQVDVVMVTLHKKEAAHVFDWWKDDAFAGEPVKEFQFGPETVSNQVALYDFLDGLVGHYEQAKGAFERYLKAHYELGHVLAGLVPAGQNIVGQAKEASGGPAGQNAVYRSLLQKAAWSQVMSKTKLNNFATEGVRRNLDALTEQQGGMAFTKPNIQALLEMLFTNRHEILHQSVVEVFDLMTKYHDKNRCHWEGWKSNDAFQVNRKVIIPDYGVQWEPKYGGEFSLDYRLENRLDDIDRAIASLENRRLDSPTRLTHLKPEPRWNGDTGNKEPVKLVTIGTALKRKFRALGKVGHLKMQGGVDNTAESEYFYLKFWKKGTVHLVFKDEALWQLFNRTAAKGKKWLPMDHEREPEPTQTKTDRDYVKELATIAALNRALALQPVEDDY